MTKCSHDGRWSSIYVELWEGGRLVGVLPKDTRDAAVRTAWMLTLAGKHPIIVAPRTQAERVA